ARVVHGDDPGDFYCEHAFFVAQKTAQDSSSSVLTNARGEKLVGFLHVPPDDHTYRAPDASLDQGQRQEAMREVIGAGLRGYFEDAAERTSGDVRLLLTGYGKFQSVQNNPTGDFVSHP